MLVLLTLHVFEFLPSGLALLNGEAHSASHSGPVGTKFWVFFEFDQATVSVAVPSIPIRLSVQWWWGWLLVVGVSSESFEGGAGKRLGGLDGAESQDEVVDGKRIGWLGGVGSG